MSKNNENKLVPKLRFSEFKDVWNPEQLSNLLDYERPDNYIVKDTNYVTDGTPVLTANKSFILGYTQETFGICNDIPAIIFDDFTVDKKFVDFPFKVKSSAIKILRPKGKDDLKFLFELMSLIRFEAKEHKRYYISAYQNLSVPIPKPTEQQKIAACLSSLDEVITAESQKLEVLKDHKKGLLQNLLPQAGETMPKFRFKEFEESGEWKETTLTQVADYENGKAHEQDIADDGEFIVVNSKFISQDGEVKKFANTAFLPATKGDVLMVLSDIPNGKAIAKCFFVEEDNRYTVNQRICRITPRDINSKILYYLLNRNQYFLAFDDGVKQTNLRKDDVLNCPLLIPEDTKEQDKIADTLSSVDDLIKAQIEKVEALQLHKKGLLQGLFPDVNEVTE
ncbi:restriction endonuclease subunit S [Arcticibacter sp. MXS-1]|uniref:restriction endonuclease subunit S n=1 Tax=Arcticibacter sp. MXS-1 TaxID=3341726 RepID=UPI0035A84D37